MWIPKGAVPIWGPAFIRGNTVFRIRSWCSVFHFPFLIFHVLFSTGNTLFGHIWSKKSKLKLNLSVKLKFGTFTNSNMQNSIVTFTFSVFDWNTLFSQTWSRKSKLLVLIRICKIRWWWSLFCFRPFFEGFI